MALLFPPDQTITVTGSGVCGPGILALGYGFNSVTVPASWNTAFQSGDAAHEASLKTVSSASTVFGVSVGASTTVTPTGSASGTGNVVSTGLNYSDTVNTAGYLTQAAGGPSDTSLPAGITVSMGNSVASNGGLAMAEIPNTSSDIYPAALRFGGGTNPFNENLDYETGTSQIHCTFEQGGINGQYTYIVVLVAMMGNPNSSQVSGVTVTDDYGFSWTQISVAATGGNHYAGIWIGVHPDQTMTINPTASVTSVPMVASQQSSFGLNGYGGLKPYTYSLASGTLPGGVTLAADGTLSGTPATAGTYDITVKATDQTGTSATSPTIAIHVAAPPALGVIANWQARASSKVNGQNNGYTYATTAVPVGNADHNWVFVIASWGATSDGVAQCFVADNAHNYYEPLAAAWGSGPYLQVFACPNAAAASMVYVSTSCYVRDLSVDVVEVQGLAGYSVDAVSTGKTTGATFTVSATATTADFALAIAATTGSDVAHPSTGWSTEIHSKQSYAALNNGPAGRDVSISYRDVTAGAVSCTWSSSKSMSNGVGVVLLFKEGVTPVYYGSNTARPVIYPEIAFGYDPSTNSLPNWTNLSSRFLSIDGTRGRSFELDEVSASSLTLELDNFDGALTPGNIASQYYPNVTLVTPVQVLADWQGRRYSLFRGTISSIEIDQDFQRQMAKIDITDDYSKLSQVLLPSAMVSDLLYDRPTHLWAMNEQSGSAAAYDSSGVNASTLVPVNSKYGAGSQAFTPTTGFGQASSGLAGTSDTSWGQYSTLSSATDPDAKVHGTCLVDRADSTLPWTSTGATYEVWAKILNNANTLATGASIFGLLTDKGTASGMHLKLTAINYNNTTTPKTSFYIGHHTTNNESLRLVNSTTNVFDDNWHHYAITVTSGLEVGFYLDGSLKATWHATNVPAGNPTRLQVGGDSTVSFEVYPGHKTFNEINRRRLSAEAELCGFFDGYLANMTTYNRIIDPERIWSHFESGSTGFDHETTGTRINRVLTWANWSTAQAVEPGSSQCQEFNYLGEGYASSGISGAVGNYSTSGGANFVDSGAQADITITDIGNSECGLILVQADGTLAFRQRSSGFNTKNVALGYLGDMDYALNQTSNFGAGLGPWASGTSNCTVTLSSGWSFAGGKSALLTVTAAGTLAYALSEKVGKVGSIPSVNETGAVTPGASMWVMSPSGIDAYLQVSYYNSAGTVLATAVGSTVYVPPLTPVLLKAGNTAMPAATSYIRFAPYIPAASATAGAGLYFDRPRLSPSGWAVPYDEDVEITEDIQYLYNDVMVTRNVDQAGYRARNQSSRTKYYPRVYTRTVYLAESDPQGAADAAQWILADYQNPVPRVTQVTVHAGTNPEFLPFVLGVDVGDVVTLHNQPVQGSIVDITGIVISVDTTINDEDIDFTYVLAPVPGWNSDVLIVDNTTTGALGTEHVLGW